MCVEYLKTKEGKHFYKYGPLNASIITKRKFLEVEEFTLLSGELSVRLLSWNT